MISHKQIQAIRASGDYKAVVDLVDDLLDTIEEVEGLLLQAEWDGDDVSAVALRKVVGHE